MERIDHGARYMCGEEINPAYAEFADRLSTMYR